MKIEYNNLYIHFVLTTLHRQKLIPEKHRVRVEKYITGIVNNNGSKLYAVYANPEHIHILLSKSPALSENKLASIIADSSASLINQNKLSKEKFEWQESASAFSVSKSDVNKVCKYIINQKEHHKKITYEQEIKLMLTHYQKTIRNAHRYIRQYLIIWATTNVEYFSVRINIPLSLTSPLPGLLALKKL